MKQTILIIGIIMLLATACSWFGEQEIPVPAGIAADSTNYEQYASCVTSCNLCEDNCLNQMYYTKAITEEDKNMCDSITSLTLQQECKNMLLATEAVSELNKEKCLMLNEDEQESCLVHVSAEVAVQSQSIDKCTESPDVVRCQDIYYMDQAVSQGNTTYCENLSENKKEICYGIIEQ